MLVNINGILARYIMRQLMVPFLCCFFGFLFLFFIGDLQDELGDMLKNKGHSMFEIALYFICILPEKIPLITPMSLLLGTMYCFANLNRHHEINAMRSSGISVLKLSIPVVLFSLFMSIMLFITNEYFQAYFKEKSAAIHEKITGEKSLADQIDFSVSDEKGERFWHLKFNEDGTYGKIMLSQRDLDGHQLWSIDATSGEFSPDTGWTFKNFSKVTYNKNSFADAPVKGDKITLTDIKDNPQTERNYRNLAGLSMGEIIKRKKSNVNFSKEATQIMDVKFYALIFTPFACMISVLLGIPLSITQERQGALASSAKAIGIMIAYYVFLHVFMNFGNSGILPAFIAGSVPTLFFLVLGVFVCLKK